MKRPKILGIVFVLSTLLFVTLCVISSLRGIPFRKEEKEIRVTEGPITSISLDKSVFQVFDMPMIFDEETILYNVSGKPVSIRSLKVGQVVTVIFDKGQGEFLAKEIYLPHPEDGQISLSSRGKAYFKKAGLITEETVMTEMEMRRRILPGRRTEKSPGEEKEKGLCH